MTEDRKAKRDWAINLNQIELLGRVAHAPAKSNNGECVRVRIVVPCWGREERQWIPFTIDVFGDQRDKAEKATVGDFFRCTVFLVDRPVVDDNQENKTVKVLQLDPYRGIGVMPAEAPENPNEPPDFGLCHSRVLLAGRNFLRKKQIDEGNKTPILREGQGGKYCFVNVRYEDPFQKEPEGDEKYYKSMFLDVSLNGEVAERVSQYCQNRAQIVVRGELTKKELDFTIKGKNPREPKVRVIPSGFSFVNFGSGGGTKKEPEAAKEYTDAQDTDGLDFDDDIPF